MPHNLRTERIVNMSKVHRILSMYDRLIEGKVLVKAEEAARFGVDKRTIQRDLDDIRAHLLESRRDDLELVYIRKYFGYKIRVLRTEKSEE